MSYYVTYPSISAKTYLLIRKKYIKLFLIFNFEKKDGHKDGKNYIFILC